ncbi:SCO family protein [Sulfuritalea hydrogenivorans]|jgi:protein SCO1/2|uniref:SCO1/SenC/PrrC protein n=1 Tax=Sulfuritalea hydrogenivorans sk43H TaxID=1223802 RepID=W0SMQ1_9PROT|nr:SCO family protein [Sulfuritalea hydrogenivorans]MDK9713575.1 SCO family protein [Sulfuritalea sp.]BAO31093.1 SCO1/SenC/PrrC protein [Sulfuritalea hydrogenivorans sk43H]
MRALLLSVLLLLIAGCSPPARFNATELSGIDWGRDFALTDHNGTPRRLADFKGRTVLMFFGYTQCPDVCPTTMSSMRELMAKLGADAERVQVLFVTVDPERDTPQLLAQYVPAFHPSFLGLYGDAAATAATAGEFKIFYRKQPGKTPSAYTVDHTAGSYVFDPRGRLRLYVRHGETPERVTQDIKRLLAGE